MRPRRAVQRLTARDAAAYIDLRRRASQTDPLAFTPPIVHDPGLVLDRVQDALGQGPPGTAACILGVFAGRLVGVLGLARDLEARDRAQLWGLYVVPEYRGVGVGLSLLSTACDLARGMDGVERLHLHVAAGSRDALRLFERFGFERLPPTGSAPEGEAVPRADVAMVLELPDEAA
jgi:ribosomal protein S18 acetylase RimI-like enzyme